MHVQFVLVRCFHLRIFFVGSGDHSFMLGFGHDTKDSTALVALKLNLAKICNNLSPSIVSSLWLGYLNLMLVREKVPGVNIIVRRKG